MFWPTEITTQHYLIMFKLEGVPCLMPLIRQELFEMGLSAAVMSLQFNANNLHEIVCVSWVGN